MSLWRRLPHAHVWRRVQRRLLQHRQLRVLLGDPLGYSASTRRFLPKRSTRCCLSGVSAERIALLARVLCGMSLKVGSRMLFDKWIRRRSASCGSARLA